MRNWRRRAATRHKRILLLGVLAVAAIGAGLLFSGVFTTQAAHVPEMSLDMDPSGNGVSVGGFGGNVMTVGTVEQCATSNPGSPIPPGPFPPPPTVTTQLIIEEVEDLVGWQTRFNYDGTKVSLSSFNETPFTSVINGAAIGFTNLPFDIAGSVHRGTTSASQIINAGLPTESVLIGTSYLGTNTFPASGDTPLKEPTDESTQTYDAPDGGVLARIIWTLRPGSDGDPSVLLEMDDESPNPPGSNVFVFTGAGTTSINLAEELSDGYIGVNTDCVPGGEEAQGPPPGPPEAPLPGTPPPRRNPTLATPPVPTEPSIIPAQVVRWGNVTLILPADSGLTAVRSFWGVDSDPPAIFLRSRGNGGSSLAIDAETGKVLRDRVEPEDRAAVNEVLKTLTVSPLDRETAPWPYSGEPPNVPRQSWGNITFIPPDPASGISIWFGHGDGLGSSSLFITVSNGRSVVLINADTGDVYPETEVIAPEDRDAFDRFLSAVQYVGP